MGRSFLFAGEHGAILHNKPETDILKTKSYSKEDTAYREFNGKNTLPKRQKCSQTKEKELQKLDTTLWWIFFERLDKEIEGEL